MKTFTPICVFFAGLLIFGTGPAMARTYQVPIEISVQVNDPEAAGASTASNRLILGIHPEATAGYDPQWDTPAFFTAIDPEDPATQPLLKAYLDHPEYSGEQSRLWRDIRGEQGGKTVWTFTVSPASSELGKPVIVAWTLPGALKASGDRIILTDAADPAVSIDMRSQESYQFVHSASAPRNLSVTVSSSSGSSDRGGSGFFGCGTVSGVSGGPSGGSTAGDVLVNLLILLSPLFFLRSRIIRRFGFP
ncbi:MAG: hypothetical protein HY760_02950 [Nitrospirae bacterium]|nr:hypothetical protein [Nitrospirota bacterium]